MDPRTRRAGGGPVPLTRPIPPLHLVTDDRVVALPDFLARAEAAAAAGGDRVAIHLRAHRGTGRALDRWAAALRRITERLGAQLWVNDRVDIALAARADGVQLGRRGLPLRDARALVGTGPRLGYSAHSSEEAGSAAAEGADIVLLGSVYATASHAGAEPVGPEAVRAAARAGVPVVAIGGISPERAREVRAYGAVGAAVLSAVWTGDADGIGDRVRAHLDAWTET